MTHKDLILDWFSRHPSITPMEALTSLGVYRLAARIGELREAGHDIRTELMEVRDRHGNTSRPARYVYLGRAT